jgi:hypothetical protein
MNTSEPIKTLVCPNCGLVKEDQIVKTGFMEMDINTLVEEEVSVILCLKCKKEINLNQ